jgi:hypothetical protein
MTNILQVVFYDLDNPMHGGQIRCQQINQKLRESGFEVTLLTIFSWSGGLTSLGPQINLSEDYRNSILGELSEAFCYAAYDSYLHTPEGLEKLRKVVDVEAFDVVWEDHPYIHRSIKSHFDKRSGGQPLYVYSSHNVESELVKQLLDNHQGPPDVKERIYQSVAALENQAVLDADVILAVTQSDLNTFSLAGTQAKLVKAPNASRPLLERNPGPGDSIISSLGLSRYALFIGSGHPPNVRGFLKMLGDNFEYVHPDFQIVCVGRVSFGIRSFFESNKESEIWLSTLRLIVEATDDEIDQLRIGASVVLLPILDGGGSNIKTAEALLSPTKILATSTAFRGFEAYSKSPGVHISNSPRGFQKTLAKISRDNEDFGIVRIQLEEHPLTWDKTLSQINSHLLNGD